MSGIARVTICADIAYINASLPHYHGKYREELLARRAALEAQLNKIERKCAELANKNRSTS